MAVYTQLERGTLLQMLSIYDVGDVRDYEGVAAGSINTSYRVTTDKGVWYLRINEGKSFRDLVYEKNLLLALAEAGGRLGAVKTPVVVENVIGGHFFPVQKRWACLFEELKGRELAVFELAPEHTRQVGAFLARAHLLLRGYHGGRRNPFSAHTVARWIDDVGRRWREQTVARRLARHFTRVMAARRPLPRGVIHGDLFRNNTKWRRGELDAVFDWEMAGRDQLALDVGICLNAWCYRRETGAFDDELCRALLEGYGRVRPFAPSERRGLYTEACLAALRFTLSRVRDFEIDGKPPDDAAPVQLHAPDASAGEGVRPATPAAGERAQRDFLDYREYEARLDALFAMGARRFSTLLP